jgi:aminomethyltransferase
MVLRTALFETHRDMGAKLVDFAGWEMPIHYGSQLEEHHHVRRDAGMFDVSHMTIVDLSGPRCREFLRHLLANDVAKLTVPGKALYTCMLNEQGGIIDDLIVYFFDEVNFRLVVNAATRAKDLAWIEKHAAAFDVRVTERDDLAMIAVQGPQAREKAIACLDPALAEAARELKRFHAVRSGEWLVARTGYTGEDGFEIMLPGERAPALWQALAAGGVAPCGLGARDTLRLEAGLNLYGSDMDETTSPLESNLAWTIAWAPPEREFVGRKSLEGQRAAGVERRLTGLLLTGRGVLRGHQRVVTAVGDGETTSGSYAPTLEGSIALARLPAAAEGSCQVQIRDRLVEAMIVEPPFVRDGAPRHQPQATE